MERIKPIRITPKSFKLKVQNALPWVKPEYRGVKVFLKHVCRETKLNQHLSLEIWDVGVCTLFRWIIYADLQKASSYRISRQCDFVLCVDFILNFSRIENKHRLEAIFEGLIAYYKLFLSHKWILFTLEIFFYITLIFFRCFQKFDTSAMLWFMEWRFSCRNL